MPPSGNEEFHERYEADGDAELRAYSAMPLASLLDRVRNRDFGSNYQLWPAIAAKAKLDEAGWVLFDVLRSDAEYLVRYHCANALIEIAGRELRGLTAVMLSGGKGHGTPQHLERVRAMLLETIGPPSERPA
jgi:hypothetical protein